MHYQITLKQGTGFEAHGMLVLHLSNIGIYSSSPIINVNGFFAMNLANLYCHDNVTCIFQCVSYSCINILSANGNGDYSVNCDHNLVSNVLCPNITNDRNDLIRRN